MSQLQIRDGVKEMVEGLGLPGIFQSSCGNSSSWISCLWRKGMVILTFPTV